MSREKTIVWKLETTPDWLTERLDTLYEQGEPPRLCFESDMNLAGHYEPEALVVTRNRMMVLEQDREEPVREVPLSKVALVKVKWLMGNGILVLTTWAKNMEMLRFSSSLTDKVEEMKEELEAYLMARLSWDDPDQHEEEVEHRDEEESTAEEVQQASRCPECGQLLPRNRDFCRACVSNKAVMGRMLAYLKPYKKLVAISLGLTAGMAAIAASVPRLSKNLIDDAIRPGNLGLLRTLSIALAALLFGRAGLGALRKMTVARLAQNVVFDLRRKVYGHLQKLSMDYHNRQSTGRLISRVLSDTARLQRFAVGKAQQFIVDLMLLFIILVLMVQHSAGLTALLWLPLPVFFFLVKWYRNNVHKVLRKAWRKRAAMSGHLADTIPGIDLVKAFGQEKRSIGEFNYLSDGYRTERVKAVGFFAKFVGCFMVLTQIGTVAVYWYGGRGAIEGSGFTIGELVMFIGWISLMYAPVRRFARITQRFERAATSAERVFDVLDTEVVVPENPDGKKLESIAEGVRFDGVCFNYENGPRVLNEISFQVDAGETVGIVGPSGSGKSTLIKLLCRYHDPVEGRILVDGEELAQISLPSFRQHLAIVSQKPTLFRDTIFENIRYGKPEAGPHEVIKAARVANAHEFIMEFPEAYDTDAREQGSRFSGGEKQRICIARAVAKDPELLILDEATSSVDTKNEQLIQEALDRLTASRTTFIIAHRLSTLRNADKIVMLKEGELLDVGTHEELMARCDPYRELVESQTALGQEPSMEESFRN